MPAVSPKEVLPPVEIPGDFYVLLYDKDLEEFTLLIDDVKQSSYSLGDAQTTVRYLERVGGPDYDVAVNHALTYGAAQVIPGQRRAIALYDRVPPLALSFEAKNAHHLPAHR